MLKALLVAVLASGFSIHVGFAVAADTGPTLEDTESFLERFLPAVTASNPPYYSKQDTAGCLGATYTSVVSSLDPKDFDEDATLAITVAYKVNFLPTGCRDETTANDVFKFSVGRVNFDYAATTQASDYRISGSNKLRQGLWISCNKGQGSCIRSGNQLQEDLFVELEDSDSGARALAAFNHLAQLVGASKDPF